MYTKISVGTGSMLAGHWPHVPTSIPNSTDLEISRQTLHDELQVGHFLMLHEPYVPTEEYRTLLYNLGFYLTWRTEFHAQVPCPGRCHQYSLYWWRDFATVMPLRCTAHPFCNRQLCQHFCAATEFECLNILIKATDVPEGSSEAFLGGALSGFFCSWGSQ